MRVTIHETAEAAVVRLEGRIAGPWADELDHVWSNSRSQFASKKLTIDLRDVLFADARGRQVLSQIFTETQAEIVAGTPWTQLLAAEIQATRSGVEGEAEHDDNA